MADNEYLKLLSNRLFWGVIIFSTVMAGSACGLYFGLKETMQDNKNEVVKEVREIKYRISMDSLRQVNRWNTQGAIDAAQDDKISLLRTLR